MWVDQKPSTVTQFTPVYIVNEPLITQENTVVEIQEQQFHLVSPYSHVLVMIQDKFKRVEQNSFTLVFISMIWLMQVLSASVPIQSLRLH